MTRGPWRAVEQVMGLPVSIALRGRHAGTAEGVAAWAHVVADLRRVDRDFSTYRADSWISRHNAGECLDLPRGQPRCSPSPRRRGSSRAVRSTYAGTASRPRRRRQGMAVEHASRRLRDLDGTDFCLSGGGDLVCWTADADGVPWQVGIEHPRDPARLVARVPVRRGAVATSGTAHRGTHIVDARTGRPPVGPAAVTVVGSDLTWVDIEATAAFARGTDAVDWLRTRSGRSGPVVWGNDSVETWAA